MPSLGDAFELLPSCDRSLLSLALRASTFQVRGLSRETVGELWGDPSFLGRLLLWREAGHARFERSASRWLCHQRLQGWTAFRIACTRATPFGSRTSTPFEHEARTCDLASVPNSVLNAAVASEQRIDS